MSLQFLHTGIENRGFFWAARTVFGFLQGGLKFFVSPFPGRVYNFPFLQARKELLGMS
jgi:hypothetical protein